MTSALTGTTIMQNHFSLWFLNWSMYLKHTEEFKTYSLGLEVGVVAIAPGLEPHLDNHSCKILILFYNVHHAYLKLSTRLL